jgi:predicted secreted protein
MSKLVFILLAFILASCTQPVKKKKHSNSPRFKLLKENHITLHKGETFNISFNANPSLGSGICWINEYKCNNVGLASRWYKISAKAKQGYIGVGGTAYWTFKAKEPGIDTIKFRSCPTGRAQKSCTAFQEDSLSYKEDLKFAPKYHRAIRVRVVE